MKKMCNRLWEQYQKKFGTCRIKWKLLGIHYLWAIGTLVGTVVITEMYGLIALILAIDIFSVIQILEITSTGKTPPVFVDEYDIVRAIGYNKGEKILLIIFFLIYVSLLAIALIIRLKGI